MNCLKFVIVCFVCTHATEIGRVSCLLIANMLFVLIKVSLEKISVKFPACVNLCKLILCTSLCKLIMLCNFRA